MGRGFHLSNSEYYALKGRRSQIGSGLVNGNNYCINFFGSLTQMPSTKPAFRYQVSFRVQQKLQRIPASPVHLTNKQTMTGNIRSSWRHMSTKDSDLFTPENSHLLRISLKQIILMRGFSVFVSTPVGSRRYKHFRS